MKNLIKGTSCLSYAACSAFNLTGVEGFSRLGHGYAIPTPAFTHSLSALQMLRICLFGLPNCRQPRTLCAIRTKLN